MRCVKWDFWGGTNHVMLRKSLLNNLNLHRFLFGELVKLVSVLYTYYAILLTSLDSYNHAE